MRLALWQQFSSNNSSMFVLVGRFESDAAHHAYTVIHDMIRQIATYYRDLTDDDREKIDDINQPRELETTLFKAHDIDLRHSIDWLFKAKPEIELISTFDQYVIISSDGLPNWWGANPFDDLMGRLGGEVYLEGGRTRQLFQIRLTCNAPDLAVARIVYGSLLNGDTDPIPWLEYYGGKQVDDLETFRQQYQSFMTYEPVLTRKFSAGGRIRSLERDPEGHEAKLIEAREQLQQAETELHDLEAVAPPLTADERKHLLHMRGNVQLLPSMQQQDECITAQFPGAIPNFHRLTVGIPAVVAWLRALGCDVTIELTRSEF